MTFEEKEIKESAGALVQFDQMTCKAVKGKGEKYLPQPGEMVLDTGDFEISGNGDPYVETIAAGVVDHHRIDNYYRAKGESAEPKCSAKMIVDYSADVLSMIKDRKVKTSVAHADGDLDSVTASYLMQSLIQTGELPPGAAPLAAHVNRADYGMFRESDPGKYLESTMGLFSALKTELAQQRDAALGREVFGNAAMKGTDGRLTAEGVARMNEIKGFFDRDLLKHMFTILNQASLAAQENPDFNPETDMAAVEAALSPEMRATIHRGKELVKKSFVEFNEAFEKAERMEVTVTVPKTKKEIAVPLILSMKPACSPLMFTNMAYQRVSPDTIVAVYAGAERKGGDMYDIGIMSESSSLIDLGELCVALNEAEKAKRDALAADDPLHAVLESQPDRKGMSGPRQVLTKEPTVLVAGGTLIAASRNSLLSPEDFMEVINKFLAKK